MGYQNTKMIQHHVHIRSTDQFNPVGVREKNDRYEINSLNDHRVWLCICVIFSSIVKVLDLLLTDHGRRNRGGGGQLPPPPPQYFANQKN